MPTAEIAKPIASTRPPKRLVGRILSGLLRFVEKPLLPLGAALIERRALTAELSELQAAVAKFGAEKAPVSVRRIERAVRDANQEVHGAAHAGDAKRLAEWLDQPAGIALTVDQRDLRYRVLNGALREAAGRGHTACVQLLMPRCDPNDGDDFLRQDALMKAAAYGRVECVDALLPWGNARRFSTHGHTALMLAAHLNSADCATLLLPYSDANAQDKKGRTPLMTAAERGSADGVRLLLPLSDTSARDYESYTALMIAAICDHADCLAALLPASDAQARHFRTGQTALAMAVRRNHAACADLLAPHSERGDADEAFERLGPENMPLWHAHIEAEALWKTLRECASDEARAGNDSGTGRAGDPAGQPIGIPALAQGADRAAVDQTSPPATARSGAMRL